MCNLFPRGVLSLNRGAFYILILCARCLFLGMRSTHTSTPKSNTSNPHFQNTTPLPYPPLQNCFKSPHNSINNFDTDFDTHPKYPLTTIYNKLSDNLKNTKNSRNPKNYIKPPLIHHPNTITINLKIISQPSL